MQCFYYLVTFILYVIVIIAVYTTVIVAVFGKKKKQTLPQRYVACVCVVFYFQNGVELLLCSFLFFPERSFYCSSPLLNICLNQVLSHLQYHSEHLNVICTHSRLQHFSDDLLKSQHLSVLQNASVIFVALVLKLSYNSQYSDLCYI